MSKGSTVQLPEATTKIYVYEKSPLVGHLVSAIKEEFHLQVENLGPTSSEGRLVEGSEFRISGTAKSMETFLKRYF
jgi:hypothetical protein